MAFTSSALTDRNRTLVNLIVSQYVATAAPVASETLARRYPLRVSPATIRNDMVELEEEGYISRPHPSAGAVPSDKAYRFFVESLGGMPPPPVGTRSFVRHHFRHAEQDPEAWTRVAVTILSQVVHNVAIASLPRAESSRVKRLELVQLQEFRVLLILVFQEARLRQQLLRVTEPVTQDQLTTLAGRLNSYISGESAREIKAHLEDTPSLENRILRETVHLLETADHEAYEAHYVEGLRHMLKQPEFAEPSRARQAVDVLEDRAVVREILTEVPDYGTVKVIIGRENRHESLRPFSLVICQYGVPGMATGTVSTVGPTRMDYATVIATVHYLAQFLSSLVRSLHGEQ